MTEEAMSILRRIPSDSVTTFSTVFVYRLVQLCVCMMLLGFMTLFELVP
jgi:hypothetical protein